MTNDGNNTLVYDAENRVLSATKGGASGSYTYDGNNLRVKKVSGGTTTVYSFSGPKVIAEYDSGAAPGAPTREYVYSGSALLAKIDSSGTRYYHQDHLSNRLVTDSNGNTVAQLGHYPFGEFWYNASSDKLQFTDNPAAGEKSAATEKPAANVIAALPLGGRIKVDPWNDQLHMLKSKPVGTVAQAENIPFQVTPFLFYLTRQEDILPAPTNGAVAAKLDTDEKPQVPSAQGLGLPGAEVPQKP